MSNFELGINLRNLGRPQDFPVSRMPPGDHEADLLLHTALSLGIGFFDTSTSYGSSQHRLGRFLSDLHFNFPVDRTYITTATKVGEFWKSTKGEWTNHEYFSMEGALRRAISVLGEISLLQIDRTNSRVLNLESVDKLIQYARTVGVKNIGATARTLATARTVVFDRRFDALHLPTSIFMNFDKHDLRHANDFNKTIIVNHETNYPSIYNDESCNFDLASLEFKKIFEVGFQGRLIVLINTIMPDQLEIQFEAFQHASQQ